MTPLNQARTELRLAVLQAEGRAHGWAELPTAQECGYDVYAARAEDHRVAVLGDVADALDRIDPGLGSRLMQALYPELALGEDPEWQGLLAHWVVKFGPPAEPGQAVPA